jgi:FtsH-binding integral membrane protein
MDYALHPDLVARAPGSARASFIRRTYGHLAGAILAFTALEMLLFKTEAAEQVIRSVFLQGPGMLLLMVAFIGGGWIAQYWARSQTSLALQYVGLGLYVLLEVVIFLPILYVAVHYSDPSVLPSAAVLTLALFGGLTVGVFATRRDFSFLGPIIGIASFVALGVIIAGMLFGFNLGLFFSFAMVALASASILYNTSNIIYHYRTDQYVAAALDLFASVALLFYYVLRILLATQRR